MISLPLKTLSEPIKVLGQAVGTTLNLPNGQIMLGLENYDIPKTVGLYVALFYGPDLTVGNNKTYDTDSAGNFYMVQEAVKLHEIVVELMSFDASARVRQQEILFAMTSDATLALLEENSMRFGTTPDSFLPVPSLEETKQLNRFRVSFTVNAIHRKVSAVSYYDTLSPVQITPNA